MALTAAACRRTRVAATQCRQHQGALAMAAAAFARPKLANNQITNNVNG